MRLIKENEYNDLRESSTDLALLCTVTTKDVLPNGQESIYYILLAEDEKDLSNEKISSKLAEELLVPLQKTLINRYGQLNAPKVKVV